MAAEASNFAWRDVAVLRPAGLDEANWYGYQCLSGDGRYAAVTVLPGRLVNVPQALLRGAYAYSVDLASGKATPVLSGVSFQYSSPGCGTGHDAAFTASLTDTQDVTTAAVVDLASGTVRWSSVLAGQVTSVVPVDAAHATGVSGTTLVQFAAGGSDAAPQNPHGLVSTGGQSYDVHATSDGGVDFLTWSPGSAVTTMSHWDGRSTVKAGSGPLSDVLLAQGRGGRNTVVGLKSGSPKAADARAADAAALGSTAQAVSIDGDAVFGSPSQQSGPEGEPLTRAISTSKHQVVSVAHQTDAAAPAPTISTSDAALPGIRLNQPFTYSDNFPTRDSAVPSASMASFLLGGSAPSAVVQAAAASTPKCGVPRLDPTRQSLQPSPAQVDWAVQMAEQGLLVGSAYTRPANYANMGLAAYAPSSDFGRISLHHPAGSTWDTVPRSVMEAIMAQESNFNQASWHALSGIAGGPLVGDYYGAGGSIRTIDYSKADCGYGIAQVTGGMAASDTSITANGKTKVAVDYEENISAGLRILQSAWNSLYDAGITANGGDPRYLENWYMAIWAYNSGIQPTAAFGNTTGCTPSATCTGPDGTWGLGWSNNPINPSYPPNRAPYLQSTYADAAHPADWPYQERVMGWMASPIIRLSHQAYAKPDYHGGQTWIQLPARTTFCTGSNLCDPNYVDPTNPSHTTCTLSDYECWWHLPATWVTNCSTTCATSSYAYTTGSSEPTYSSPHPPTCNVDPAKLPTTAQGAPIIVDDLANPAQNRQGCTSMNWSTNGTFTMAYGTNANGDPIGQIDTHQLGAGFGGHIYFTHTEAAGDTPVINTGTWTPNLPSLQYYKVKIHVPATGAAATDVVYTINPGGGANPWKIRVNQAWGSEQWVTIGTFAMQNGGNVQLSNASSMAAGVYDVAFDAIAFLPQGGTPGQPIGGPPTVQDAPKGSNPAWVNCGCVRRTEGDPVDTATGYFGETLTDLSTPGRGAALEVSRTYNSALADPAGPNATLATDGPFGHGWSFNYALTATTNPTTGTVTIAQEDGSRVAFTTNGSSYTPASPRFDATLSTGNGTLTYTRRGTDVFTFDVATGRLLSQTDLAGTQAVPAYATTFSYDASGNLATVTDPAGRTYTFTWTGTHIVRVDDGGSRRVDYAYNAAGDLTDVYGPATGRTGSSLGDQDHTQYTYDSHHLMVSLRTPANFGSTATPTPVTSMVYDSAERVTSQTDPDGRTTTFSYGPNANLTAGQTRVVNAAGNATLYTYQNGLLTSETRGDGSPVAATWSYTYDPLTLGITTVADPNGHVTTATYDDHGNKTSSSNALGYTTTYQYDDHGRVLLTTDPSGTQTAATYNAAGMLTATSTGRPGQTAEVADGNPTDPSVRTTSRTYADPAHPADLTSSTDARGKTTTYNYDTVGYPIKTTDPLNHSTLARFDQRTGQLLATVTPLGTAAGTTTTCTAPATGCTTYEYDAHGRLTATHDPGGHTTSTTYDADGRRLTSTDANGHTTSFGYDPAGEQVSTTRADGTVLKTTYTGDGQLATTADPAGATTTYGYDAQGRRTSSTDPDNRTTTTGYDPSGNTATLTRPDGTVTTYVHDAADRLTAITYSDGATPKVTYTYDASGRRATMTDGTGTTQNMYDAFGELTTTTDGAGNTLAYAYDQTGNVTAMTYPGSGRTLTRTYDDAGTLVAIKDWNNKTTSFGYDANSRLLTTSAGNGTTITNTFDAVGAPQSTVLTKGNTNLASITVVRDAAENITSRADAGAAGSGSQTFAYDTTDQVTSVSDPNAVYGYDTANHPTAMAGATQSFDAAGQLCWTSPSTETGDCATPPAGAVVYTNTINGQRAERTGGGGDASSYTWNQAGELTSASTALGTASYSYDGDGLRTQVSTGGRTSRSVWDRTGPVPVLIDDGTTAYVYGPTHLPVEQIGTSTQWFFADAEGSTIALTDSTGAVCGTYAYDAWGKTTQHTGVDTVLRYVGQIVDGLTGFVYLRARYYDPATAQFISVDPLVALTHAAFTYVDNNPLNATDLTGEWSKRTWVTVGLLLGATALLASGVGAGAAVGLYELAASTSVALGATALATGTGALVLDAGPCREGDKYACAGAVMGGAGVLYGGVGLSADIVALEAGGYTESTAMVSSGGAMGGFLLGGGGLTVDLMGAGATEEKERAEKKRTSCTAAG